MFNQLKKWLVYGRLTDNQISFEQIELSGTKETIIIVDKWVFTKELFLRSILTFSSRNRLPWSKLSKHRQNNELDFLKDDITKFWSSLSLENKYINYTTREFIDFLFDLFERIELNPIIFNYTARNKPLTLIIMLDNWEKSLKSNAVSVQ